MEEVIINITEEVEEVTINVLEGGAIDIDDTVTEMSQNAVKSSGIWTAINNLWQSFSGALSNVSDSISNHINAQNDAHPAKAITVSAPVTPDYTAPKVGDTMQDITNKVAGLQDGVIWEEVFEHDITEFELSIDKDGKQLDERGVLILVDGVVSSSYNNGWLRLNSISSSTYWNSVTNSILNHALIYCNGVADNMFSGTIQCYRNNNNIIIQQLIGNSVSTTGAARTSAYTASLPLAQNITNIRLYGLLWRAGSQIKIYRL